MIGKVITAVLLSVTITTAAVPQNMEYVGDYRVTAYAFYEGGENYYTASGATPVPYYTVATGEEFPFGTVLYIEGIGTVEVQDRGGFDAGIIDLHIGNDPMESFEDTTRKVYIVR